MEDFDYIVFSSCGNDSVALTQFLIEKSKKIIVIYSDTGWAKKGWETRVEKYKDFLAAFNIKMLTTSSIGMVGLIEKYGYFPSSASNFCTDHLKRVPAKKLLDEIDPMKELICCVGVRREESPKRRLFPEFTEQSKSHGNRSLWAPLVNHTERERDELIKKTGIEILSTRSKECFPCVHATKNDTIELLEDKERIEKIKELEQKTGKFMFHPSRRMGAKGIEEVLKWAKSKNKQQYELFNCDSGFCE